MVANKGVTSEAMTTPITQGNAEAGLLQGNHSQQSKNIASAMLANQVIAEIRFSQIPQTQNFSLCRHNWQRPKIAAELAIAKYAGGGRIEKSGWVIHSKYKTLCYPPPQFVILQERAQCQFFRAYLGIAVAIGLQSRFSLTSIWQRVMTYLIIASLLAFAPQQDANPQQEHDPIFSGPQVGEPVASFSMTGVFGKEAHENIDLVKRSDGGPLLLIFVHERSRPAIGLSNTLAKFAASLDGQLTCGICYLTDDSSEARNWMKRFEQYFDKSVSVGIAADGVEGPGQYGLNRNVAVTIVAANQNEVTANFALMQPELQADGQAVIDAVATMMGNDSPPRIAQFLPRRDRNAGNQVSRELGLLLRQLVNKQATAAEVDEVAKKVDEFLKEHPEQTSPMGALCHRLVNGEEPAGTEAAQKYLADWSKKYARMTDKAADKR